MSKNLKKNSYEGENIEIIVPQEIPDNYHKLPVALVKWQPYLNPIHYTVLTYIVSRIHQRRCYAFPSIKTAAEECNICENSFNKGVNLLEALGLIAIERSAKGNKYFLRPPVEPELHIIEKHLDEKAVKKFKKREMREEGESSINFKKVHYFKPKKNSSSKIHSQISNNSKNSSDDTIDTHQMSTNKIYQNLNLSNSNLNSGQSEVHETKEKSDVVNFENIKIIKSYGVTSKKAKELSKQLHPDIQLDSFIKYILNDVGKFVDIKNTSGFLIHGLKELQEDFLDIERKKKDLSKSKTKKDQLVKAFRDIKTTFEKKGIEILDRLDKDKKDFIWKELVSEDDYLRSNELSAELREGYYLDYINRHYLKLSDNCQSLLSTDAKLVTEKDLEYLKEKLNSLKLE